MENDTTSKFANNPPPPPYPPQPQGSANTAPPEPKVVYQYAGQVLPPGQNHVVVVQQQQAPGNFGTEPVVTTCNNFSCRQEVTTIVEDKIKQEGWLWCEGWLCSLFLVLGCFWSWCIGLLACCMDGFK